MLTPDVRFEGWTTEQWSRFLSLWKPHAPEVREENERSGGLIVVHDGAHESGRIVKLLHTNKGRLEPGGEWPRGLAALADEHGASWVISGHYGSLDQIMERFGARIGPDHDTNAQAVILVSIVRDMIRERKFELWPHRLRGVPVPTETMLRRAMDSICADGKAILLGMFKDEELWTAFVARRKGQGFDVIAGPEELRYSMGLLSGDWRRDYRYLVRAVEEYYAPLAFGCFAEVDSFRELQVDARAGAWSRAVAIREVVLSPVPVAVGLAVGVDTARYAIDGVRAIASRLDPFGFAEPAMRFARGKIASVAAKKDLSGALGFEPLAALRALLKR